MTPQEKDLLLVIASHSPINNEDMTVRRLIDRSGIPYKQCCYWLKKWSRKGWYEYGVTLDLGWLTDEGLAEAERHRR